MNIYGKNYRKIYEQYNGPIPIDDNGRTYEIHHIDGNHNNNNPLNLKAVSIQEHYDIHYAQGDYYACLKIEMRKNTSPEEISRLITLQHQQRVKTGTHNLQKRKDGTSVASDMVKNGTHPWQKRKDGTSLSQDMVKNGTHPFQKRSDGTSLSQDRVKNETHPWQKRKDGTSLSQDRVKNGTHNLLGPESNNKRIKNGTHNLLGPESNNKRIKNGTHNFVGYVTCYNKLGDCVSISKEQYHSQTGPKENWEYVHNMSKEGKRRKHIK